MGRRGVVALFGLSSWCLVIVVWLFLAVPWVCLLFVIVVFSDNTHLLFLMDLFVYLMLRVGSHVVFVRIRCTENVRLLSTMMF